MAHGKVRQLGMTTITVGSKSLMQPLLPMASSANSSSVGSISSQWSLAVARFYSQAPGEQAMPRRGVQ
jgi:hypothetical protein